MINDYLELAGSLRSSGYSGHITCGGHVPTFCYRELLEDMPAIDTVVRHEGEETLVEMLSMLSHGETPSNIPGLVWREDSSIALGPTRPLIHNLDTLPQPKRRLEPFRAGGVPIAFILTSYR